jgi:CheY-like chemotaxis protein
MVYGFVKQSRGHVRIYSEMGKGTAIKMFLPRAGVAESSIEQAPADAAGLTGTETILLVEDDALVRGHAIDQLAELGYRVIAAENGTHALELLRSNPDIDLLFTDVVMPGGLNGRELAEQAVQLRPGLRVLYTSGYTENSNIQEGRLGSGVQLLDKPYRAIDLARKVRAVLSRPAG